MADAKQSGGTSASQTVEQPLDLIRLSLGERVLVKCRGGRVLTGVLNSFDGHLNLILGECEEVHTEVMVDEDTGEEISKVSKRSMELLFVRGDAVILISPPLRR
jgi:U6 snRNA-associated Sm-like protein LSm3